MPRHRWPRTGPRRLDRISADSLKGHLSFLASDLLEGRDTPSRGLDLAAEYIAAQFRRAGLEPVGDDGYFQTAEWQVEESDPSSFRFEAAGGGKTIVIGKDRVSLAQSVGIDVPPSASIKVDYKTSADLKPEEIAGKVVMVELPDLRKVERAGRAPILAAIREFQSRMSAAKVALVVSLSRDPDAAVGLASGRLIDPQAPPPPSTRASGVPMVAVHDPAVVALFDAMPVGPAPAEGPGRVAVSVHLDPPTRRPVKLRNVVGLLRGSDPAAQGYTYADGHPPGPMITSASGGRPGPIGSITGPTTTGRGRSRWSRLAGSAALDP